MTIEKRGKTYRATAYKKGTRYRKTFATKSQAMAWLIAMEKAPDVKNVEAKGKTCRDLIERYRDIVTPTKKGHRAEYYMLTSFLSAPFADRLLANLGTDDFDELFGRLRTKTSVKTGRKLKMSSIVRLRNLLSAVFTYCVKIGWLENSPLKNYTMRAKTDHRDRIASPNEIARLLDVVKWDGKSVPANLHQLAVAAFLFSTMTGMRRGEILAIRREWIDERVIHLPDFATKTNSARDVALSKKARALLDAVLQRDTEKPFAIKAQTVSVFFTEIRDAAGLGPVRDADGHLVKEGLNFHDGRATFATWAASHLTPLALARQLGHADLKMTMRYYRSRPEQVADLLDKG